MNNKLQGKDQIIVQYYTVQHLTTREISKLLETSHTAIWKVLQRLGITVQEGERVVTHCSFCGKELERHRKRWKNNLNNYCNRDCYFANIENPRYFQSRQGQRIARVIVSQYFNLTPDMIVHHIDGDTRNNDRDNLVVFQNNGDHVSHHRKNGKAKPIWEGKKGKSIS